MAFEVLSLLEATVAYIAFSEDHDEARKSAMHHKVRDMIQVERREIRSKRASKSWRLFGRRGGNSVSQPGVKPIVDVLRLFVCPHLLSFALNWPGFALILKVNSTEDGPLGQSHCVYEW